MFALQIFYSSTHSSIYLLVKILKVKQETSSAELKCFTLMPSAAYCDRSIENRLAPAVVRHVIFVHDKGG